MIVFLNSGFTKMVVGILSVIVMIILLFVLGMSQGIFNATHSNKTDENHIYLNDYKNLVVEQSETNYDKNIFAFRYFYYPQSTNKFVLEYCFGNNKLDTESKKNEIYKVVENVYAKIKDKYIVKKGIMESKAITIDFWFSEKSPNSKQVDFGEPLCTYTVNISGLENEKWPDYDVNNFVWNH